jgi:ATP-binding cassette, subfamily B, beta-glucan exporter
MSIVRTYSRALRLLKQERTVAAALVFASLILAAAQFAEPLLFGRIIDKMTQGETRQHNVGFLELLPLISAWIGFALFSIVGTVFIGLFADRLAHRRRLAAMGLYFEHVLHLPLSFHAEVHSGRLLKVMLEGAMAMFWLWLAFFREKSAALIALIILLPLSLFINWRLAVLLICLVGVFGALVTFVVRRTEKLQSAVERINTSLTERASDVLGNIPVIQSFTRIQSEARAVGRLIEELLLAQLPVLNWWAIAVVGTRAASTLTLLSIFSLGAWLHGDGLATIGEIVAFMSFATLLIARLDEVVSFVNGLFLQAPKLQDFFDVLETEPRVTDRPGARDPGRLEGHVVFDHVCFSYDDRKSAVDDVSFDIASGRTVALVGATGSGKSTTLNLLHRVFDPQQGSIEIDGIDIRDMTLSGLRANIGVVFQEPMLFARSIEENLRIGDPDATPAKLSLALERAQAADFVQRQSEGLATIVGERGRTLSGGERQRLSIARALLKDPPIMIFDEATSAVDAQTERQLQSALESATAGRTTFIIAHRLATIKNADLILVFDQGRIVETGRFDELVAQNGRFAALARAQFMSGQSLAAANAYGDLEQAAPDDRYV